MFCASRKTSVYNQVSNSLNWKLCCLTYIRFRIAHPHSSKAGGCGRPMYTVLQLSRYFGLGLQTVMMATLQLLHMLSGVVYSLYRYQHLGLFGQQGRLSNVACLQHWKETADAAGLAHMQCKMFMTVIHLTCLAWKLRLPPSCLWLQRLLLCRLTA